MPGSTLIRMTLSCTTFLAGASELALPARPQTEPADIILTGGRVYTVDPARPRAEAVAIRGDRIAFVGSDRKAMVFRGRHTRLIDVSGRTVVPGMIDAHAHVAAYGQSLRNVDLRATASFEDVVARVRSRAERTPPGEWIMGWGWDQNLWPDPVFPAHQALSAAVPDHPVLLSRIGGHTILVNRRVLDQAGITRDTPVPPGGRIERDRQGEPSGVFVDEAMTLVYRVVPRERPDQVRDGILLAQRALNRFGVTAVHDAGVGGATVAIWEALAAERQLTVRNYLMVADDAGTIRRYFGLGPRPNVDGRYFLAIRSIKMSADGALGSRGAALLEPYSDAPDHRGLLVLSKDSIRAMAAQALRRGFQLNVHAIGDRANRAVLDAFGEALQQHPTADHRFRIEHASVIDEADLPRLARMGVIPSMQATFAISDWRWMKSRLGPSRVERGYAWRSVLGTGVIVPGSSDVPVEPPDPIRTFYAAITRQDERGQPTGGWHPDQRLTREEALKHVTLWPAYAAFQEDLLGSITPGKLADLVVLSQDVMAESAQRLLATEVLLTMVGGEIMYDAATASDSWPSR